MSDKVEFHVNESRPGEFILTRHAEENGFKSSGAMILHDNEIPNLIEVLKNYYANKGRS